MSTKSRTTKIPTTLATPASIIAATRDFARISISDRQEAAHRELHRLGAFLQKIEEEGITARTTTDLAIGLLGEIWTKANVLVMPDVCPGEDGELLLKWDDGAHHLELEVFPDSHCEFFYLNRQTDEAWDASYAAGQGG